LTLKGVEYDGTFQFGGCTVRTTEYQVEHWLKFLGKDLHLFSTNTGTVSANGTNGACILPLPPPYPAIDLNGLSLPFAATDTFDSLTNSVRKSSGMTELPGHTQVGAFAYRVSTKPVTFCGYAYLYGGPYPLNSPTPGSPQLVIPFRDTINNGVHQIDLGVACMPTWPWP
jgi:hypothetical protein